MAAVCGRGCGVAAIGRCALCGQPFCASHGAFGYNHAFLVDRCGLCHGEQVEAERLATGRDQRQQEREDAESAFAAVLAALQAAGHPGAEPLVEWEPPTLRTLWRARQRPVSNVRGWHVGVQRWSEQHRGATIEDIQADTFCTTAGAFWKGYETSPGRVTWTTTSGAELGGRHSVDGRQWRLAETLRSVVVELRRHLS